MDCKWQMEINKPDQGREITMNIFKRNLTLPKNSSDKKELNGNESIVSDYAENATAHGVGKIKGSKNNIVRLFWILVFLTFIGCVIKQIYGLGLKISSNDYRTYVQSTVQRSLTFPAITICNTNAFSSFKLQAFAEKKFPNVTSWTDDEYLEKVNNLQRFIVKLNVTQVRELGQQPESLFKANKCMFNAKKCQYPEDLRLLVSPKSGNCYTFNDNGTLHQPRVGYRYGLFIVLNIHQDSYNVYHDQTFPISAGVTISIHNPKQSLNLRNNAILASPNQLTRIAVRKKGVFRLKAPYKDNCTDTGNNMKLFHPGNYTVDSCLNTCYILKMNETCSVVDVTSAVTASLHAGMVLKLAISDEEKQCTIEFNIFFKEGKIRCDCQVVCEEETYETTVSSAEWPANSEVDILIKRMNLNISKERFKENFLALQIYYKDLTVETTYHQPAYDVNDFFSALGGQLGLWIGGSFFSIVEVIVLVFSLLMNCILPKTIENTKEKNENYDRAQTDKDLGVRQ